MDDALEDIEYLSRSPHRVRVLESLAAGPVDRRTLLDEQGVSRATLGRTLEAFQQRAWVTRYDGQYLTTTLGRTVLQAVLELVEVVESTHVLRPVAEFFPFDDAGFDPARLTDAKVVLPTTVDADGPLHGATATVASASRVLMVTGHYVRGLLDALYEAVDEGTMIVGLVVTGDVLDAISGDGALAEQFTTFVRNPAVSAHRFDGDIAYESIVADETVIFGLRDEAGTSQGIVATEDQVVREWATGRFAAHSAAGVTIPDDASGA